MGQLNTKIAPICISTIIVIVLAFCINRYFQHKTNHIEVLPNTDTPSPPDSQSDTPVFTPETSPEPSTSPSPPRSPPRPRSASQSPKKRPSPIKTDLALPGENKPTPKITPEDQIIIEAPAALGSLAPGGEPRDVGDMITISREMESGESASFDSLRRRQNRPSAGAESDWRTVARLNSPGRFHHRKEAVEKDLDARDPNFIADARRYLGIETGDRGGGGPGKSNE